MIMRIWHGTARKSKSNAFFRYLMQTGVPWYRSLRGNRGVIALKRSTKDICEFLLLSIWDSVADIRRFAGRDIDKAIYNFDRDRDYLLELEPLVAHYRILSGFVFVERDTENESAKALGHNHKGADE